MERIEQEHVGALYNNHIKHIKRFRELAIKVKYICSNFANWIVEMIRMTNDCMDE